MKSAADLVAEILADNIQGHCSADSRCASCEDCDGWLSDRLVDAIEQRDAESLKSLVPKQLAAYASQAAADFHEIQRLRARLVLTQKSLEALIPCVTLDNVFKEELSEARDALEEARTETTDKAEPAEKSANK